MRGATPHIPTLPAAPATPCSVHDYGAMANSSASNVTLCLKSISGTTHISVVRVAADSILGDSGSVSPQADAGSPTATSSAVAPVPAADVASHCSCAADDAGGSCSYRAWVLPLEPGQNQFNVTVARSGSISIKGSSSEQVRGLEGRAHFRQWDARGRA